MAVCGFGIVALYTGNAELLKELGSTILVSAASFGAGYGFRWYRESSDGNEE